MLGRLIWIGGHAARETFHQRLPYHLVGFALLMLGCVIFLSRLTLGDPRRLVLDAGLATINLVGVLIAVFVGSGLVNTELERRTLYPVLTTSLRRHEFVLGKYLGLMMILAGNLLIMGMGLIIVLQVMHVSVDLVLITSLLLMLMECGVMGAIAVLCSTCTTPTLGAICALGVYVIGHAMEGLTSVASKLDPLSHAAIATLHYVLPDLERLNLKAQVVYQTALSCHEIVLALAYGTAYVSTVLLLACWIFERRDLG